VQGERAYLAGNKGIAIVDLTDPAQPHIVSQFSLPRPSYGIEVEADLLYVGSQDGLRIFPLDGKDELQEIGHLVAERAWDFARVGQWAYLLGRFPGLRGIQLIAVDLTNPTAPQVRGSYSVRLGDPSVLVMSDTLAVIKSEINDGIIILGVDGPRFVDLGRKRFPENPFIQAVAVDGQQFYLLHDGTLIILDLDGRRLREVGNYTNWVTGFISRLFVVGDLLVLSGASFRSRGVGELLIYEQANLQQPVGYLRLDTPMNVNLPIAMGAKDRRLYLGEGWPSWKIFSCSFPPPPTNAGLRIVDLADPSAPRVLAYLSTGDSFVNDLCRR